MAYGGAASFLNDRLPMDFASDSGRLEMAFHNCQHLMSDHSLLAICATSPHLRRLDLSGCLLITDKALAIVATLCPFVEWISVSKCPLVTERGLLYLACSLPRLVHLDASGCRGMTDVALATFASNCPHLQSLCLACCTSLTDAGLSALASAWAQPAPADLPAHAPRLYGATRGSQVVHLDLSGCTGLSGAALDALLQHVTRVSCLRLAGLPGLGDAQLATAAAASGASLAELDVSRCARVTDFGLRDLVLLAGPDGLRCLRVAGCDMTEAGLVAVAEECPHLEELDARNCPRLLGWKAAGVLARWSQGEGWGGGVAGCLRTVDARGCPGWDASVVAYLAHACPRLAVVGGGQPRTCDATMSVMPCQGWAVRDEPVGSMALDTMHAASPLASPPLAVCGQKRGHDGDEDDDEAGSGSCTHDGGLSSRRVRRVMRRVGPRGVAARAVCDSVPWMHRDGDDARRPFMPLASPPISACDQCACSGYNQFSSALCALFGGDLTRAVGGEGLSASRLDMGPLGLGVQQALWHPPPSSPHRLSGGPQRFDEYGLLRSQLWGAVTC